MDVEPAPVQLEQEVFSVAVQAQNPAALKRKAEFVRPAIRTERGEELDVDNGPAFDVSGKGAADSLDLG
jgi:hypothetical protein